MQAFNTRTHIVRAFNTRTHIVCAPKIMQKKNTFPQRNFRFLHPVIGLEKVISNLFFSKQKM